MNIVRESKFRFIYGELSKPNLTGDQEFITANTKYFAVAISGGGGPVLVYPHDKGSYVPIISEVKALVGHKGRIFDFEFDPFDEERLATASEDTTIRIWKFPEGGLTENITESITLEGHTRKVLVIKWNKTARNILASAGGDYTVRIWDVEKQTCNITLDSITEFVQSMDWNYNGDKLVIDSKDKMIRVWEPLTNNICCEFNAHDSVRTSKCCWIKNKYVITTGFNKMNSREIKMWDIDKIINNNNEKNPVNTTELDRSSGALFPYYDSDLNILYIYGKGDSCIHYYEICEDTPPYLFYLNRYNDTTPIKGIAICPKRIVNVMKCEIARVLKLTDKSVEPISFIVPRRSEAYQDDLYPPCFSGKCSCESSEWFNGIIKETTKMSLNPKDSNKLIEGSQSVVVERKTYQQLEKELEEAKKRIEELEKENAELKKELSK